MPWFVIAVFLMSASVSACCHGSVAGFIPEEEPAGLSERCPPSSEEDHTRWGDVPVAPFINVSAVIQHYEGYHGIPIEIEELKHRLRYDPETKYNASGLISSKGYPVENYEVPTVDGFLIGMQRIPHGINNSHTIKGPRPAVLLQHGLFACSTNWVSNLANQSLGFILADAGYDVWLGNARGNTYSKKHLYLKESQREFWYWSWDEMAKYDLPAMVDFILNKTDHKQISYVGHSQGTTTGFAAFSTNKDLESKINLFVALAPVANVSHMTSALKLLTPPHVYIPLVDFLDDLHLYQFLPNSEIFDIFANTICDTKETVILCEAVIFLLGGYSTEHMNASRIPVYVSNNPAGTSIWDLAHWAQIINSANFSMYNYGCKENVNRYNQTIPPAYNVQDINVPIATFSGARDVLADPTDVAQLIPEIKNLVYKKEIDTYGHMDFIWAIDAVTYVYQDVVKLLSQVNSVKGGESVDSSGHPLFKPAVQ